MVPAGHLGAGTAHERVGQRALARAVGPHDHVHLAAAHRRGRRRAAPPAAGGRVQVPHLEHVLRRHGSTTETVPSATSTSYTATGLGGRQRAGLAGQQVERAAVAGALDLALLDPHLALGQRVVLVAALVVDGVELVADAHQRDAVAGHVEAPRLARTPARRRGRAPRSQTPAAQWLRAAQAASRRSCTSRSQERRRPRGRAAVDDGVEEAPHDQALGHLGRHAP